MLAPRMRAASLPSCATSSENRRLPRCAQKPRTMVVLLDTNDATAAVQRRTPLRWRLPPPHRRQQPFLASVRILFVRTAGHGGRGQAPIVPVSQPCVPRRRRKPVFQPPISSVFLAGGPVFLMFLAWLAQGILFWNELIPRILARVRLGCPGPVFLGIRPPANIIPHVGPALRRRDLVGPASASSGRGTRATETGVAKPALAASHEL